MNNSCNTSVTVDCYSVLMKRVCLVSDTVFDLNGVSRFIQDFAKESKVQKKEFYVLTSTTKIGLGKFPNIKSTLPVLSMKMPFYNSLDLVLPSYFKIKKMLELLNPDLLHISTPGPVGLCALIIAKRRNIPVVGVYHTDFPAYLYKNTHLKIVEYLSKQYLKYFYKSFQALFCRSSAYEAVLQKELNFKEDKLFALKAGINIKRFHPMFEDQTIWKALKIEQNSFKVLYVGRISVEKNIAKLLKIWEQVRVQNKVLVLVGDDYMKLDKTFCKNNSVVAVGRKQGMQLSQIYASSDCFVFPSTTDTLGQVVMEAMASALPVIVTNQGGPKTFVKPNSGYVLDINNQSAWVKAIEELSYKNRAYEALSQNAYESMQEYTIAQSFQHFWKQNEQIYTTSVTTKPL